MPRFAFIFPGQGAQYPGMGKEIADQFPEAAHIFELADDILGYKLSSLCFNGPAEQLNKTEFAQPALLTCSLAVLEVIKKFSLTPSLLAGLSLGEYTALVSSGALSMESALPLVRERAFLMQNAVPEDKGAMAAIIGLDYKTVMNSCQQAPGIVDIANYNCPGQMVISGEKETVKHVAAELQESGGRVKILAVSVPSHSRLMKDAAMKLESYLETVELRKPEIEVVSNVNASKNDVKEIKNLLVKQLFSPILWEQSISYMMQEIDYFIEIGPGTTLSSLIKRIDRSRLLGNIEDNKSLKKVLKKVDEI